MTGGTPSWMGGDPSEGETYVDGKDQATAAGLLASADALGEDRQTAVRAVTGGFVVTDTVYDHYARTLSHPSTDPDHF